MMRKWVEKSAVVILIVIATTFGVSGFIMVWSVIIGQPSGLAPFVATVYADDDDEDEDDEEEDEDEEDDDDRKNDSAPTTETRYVTHYEVRQVSRLVTVIPEEYRKDSDGDGLVDALDPNPLVHQREYFTDDDGDAVPNIFDRHPDEDDFAYFDSEYDTNGDGIIDSFEQLARP